MKRRAYQSEALQAMKAKRLFALLFERQAGKSTTLADMALKKMMKTPGSTVIYASASLLLGREIVMKQTQAVDASAREVIKKESQVLQGAAKRFSQDAKDAGMLFQTADASKDRVTKELSAEDFEELFQAQRLEFRVYHDRTSYSRTQVIAPNVATARGWSGMVLLDEIAFIRDFMDLWVAIEPIISTNPEFKLILATTPPQDDTHACFELLSAPAGMEFKANPRGNWYESEAGIPVLRADAFDTFAAGKKIFDLKTGQEISPAESFAHAINKDGWRINHGLQWLVGGTAACNLLYLKTAQERGIWKCDCFIVDSDEDFDRGIAWLAEHISPSLPVGLGFDVATTTKDTSNPSVVSVVEAEGSNLKITFFVWKTRDPEVARFRLDKIATACEQRPVGRVRAMAIDATNEKYFAEDVRRQFMARFPVHLIVASEKVEKPGLQKPTNWKEYLGDQYVAELEDNHLTLPPSAYVRIDHRLVKKDRGMFVCAPTSDGCHGDTFDAGKLGVHAVTSKTAGITSVEGISMGGQNEDTAPMFVPEYL